MKNATKYKKTERSARCFVCPAVSPVLLLISTRRKVPLRCQPFLGDSVFVILEEGQCIHFVCWLTEFITPGARGKSKKKKGYKGKTKPEAEKRAKSQRRAEELDMKTLEAARILA